MEKTIDLSQCTSFHEAAAIERTLGGVPNIVVTSESHTPATLEGIRAGLISGIKDLQDATATAFQQYDERTAQYYDEINGRLNAFTNYAENIELVLDSLIKMLVVGDKMPPETLKEHQQVLATFLGRNLPPPKPEDQCSLEFMGKPTGNSPAGSIGG